jgi:hypothetical protein
MARKSLDRVPVLGLRSQILHFLRFGNWLAIAGRTGNTELVRCSKKARFFPASGRDIGQKFDSNSGVVTPRRTDLELRLGNAKGCIAICGSAPSNPTAGPVQNQPPNPTSKSNLLKREIAGATVMAVSR